jgi:hypothetical protein
MKKKCNHLRADVIHRPWVKILIAMKLTVILSLLIFTQAFAFKSYSQRTVVNLKMENVTIKDVLRAIEEKSSYYFLYNNDLINVNRKVSIDAKSEKIESLLNQLFIGSNITYTIQDRQIVLSPLPVDNGLSMNLQQKNKSIKGRVSESNGSALPGVSVIQRNFNYRWADIP